MHSPGYLPHDSVDLDFDAYDLESDAHGDGSESSSTDTLLPFDGEKHVQQAEHRTRRFKHLDIFNCLKATCRSIIPSFLQCGSPESARTDSSLAALDGLRGLACLCVLNQHFTSAFTDRMVKYGFRTTPDDVTIPQWPLVKVFWTGSAQVFTFFVLSGYVLSVKSLKQMRSREPGISKTMSSAVFRRGLRLFMPCIAVLTIVAVLGQCNFYQFAGTVANMGLIATSDNVILPQPTARDMFNVLLSDIAGISNFFNWTYYTPMLQGHLWTINTEFRASILLFIVLIGTARLRSCVRIILCTCFVVYLCFYSQSYVALFFCGMICCDLDLAFQALQHTNAAHDLPHNASLTPRWTYGRTSLGAGFEKLQRLKSYMAGWIRHLTEPSNIVFRLFHLLLFILGVYLICCPHFDGESNPGYSWLFANLMPSWYHALYPAYFMWTLGSICLLISAVHSHDIRPIYTNSFSQYSGRISFALYIVQRPVLHATTYALLPGLQTITKPLGGRSTQAGFVTQWILGAIVTVPAVVFFADLLWRALDLPSVRLARWLEGKCEDVRWRSVQ